MKLCEALRLQWEYQEWLRDTDSVDVPRQGTVEWVDKRKVATMRYGQHCIIQFPLLLAALERVVTDADEQARLNGCRFWPAPWLKKAISGAKEIK
jgi:hypothetical protein